MAIAINGNGTITGITAGGLPDASIVDADIAAVAATKLTGTVADARLPTVPVAKGGTGLTAVGASGQVLHLMELIGQVLLQLLVEISAIILLTVILLNGVVLVLMV